MNKKICLIMVGYLNKYPPILSFIQATKDLGYDLTVMAAGNNSNIENYPGYDFTGVKAVDVIGEYESDISKVAKLLRMQKISKALWTEIEKPEYADHLFVIVSEITVKHLGDKIKKLNYVLYQLELIEGYEIVPHVKLLQLNATEIGNASKGMIVCEYNRAHITKTWWKLNRLPYIIKNKPYVPSFEVEQAPENVKQMIASIQEAAKGRHIVLYQGIVNKQRPIGKFVQAVSQLSDRYFFVSMSNTVPEVEGELPENFMHVPFIAPPYHLAVTSIAHIGILVYISGGKSSYSSLNPVYCAPNKIWEYAKFGVPMIANDNPALEMEFSVNGIGCCARSLDGEDIVSCINKIEAKYEDYYRNALTYFDSYDVKEEIAKILNSIEW